MNDYYRNSCFNIDPPIGEDVFVGSIHFRCKEPNLEGFSKHYESSEWLGTKVTALPRALWSGVIKSMYHLAKAVFFGLPAAPFDYARSFRVEIFSFVRDLQEAFGRILMIFNDKVGLYHVQQAQFYKEAYSNAYSSKIIFDKID